MPTLRLIPRSETEPAPQAAEGGVATSGSGSGPASAPLDFDRLFQLYATDVAARGVAMLGSPDEADDLVQEVFLRAYRALGSLTDPAAVKPWLMTIAVREGLRRLKRRRLSRLWLPGQDFDFERLADPGAPQDVKLQIGRLFRVLDKLAAELRVAWVLRHLECETTEKVAELCGWSLSTTKRRLNTAHEQVTKRMGA